MADKDTVERRVYNLPADLLVRLRAFQVAQGIGSEAEAARRLIDSALQMRDSVDDILMTLKAGYAHEKDLRVLARDILTNHILVTEIILADQHVLFRIRTGNYGKITLHGRIYSGEDPDYMRELIDQAVEKVGAQTRAVVASRKEPHWALPGKAGADLEDEIPF